MSQTEYNQYGTDIQVNDVKPCFCEKTACMIGIASVVIGIGGFIVANLL